MVENDNLQEHNLPEERILTAQDERFLEAFQDIDQRKEFMGEVHSVLDEEDLLEKEDILETKKDKLWAKIMSFAVPSDDMKKMKELSAENKELDVKIPEKIKQNVLKKHFEYHGGMSYAKGLSRIYSAAPNVYAKVRETIDLTTLKGSLTVFQRFESAFEDVALSFTKMDSSSKELTAFRIEDVAYRRTRLHDRLVTNLFPKLQESYEVGQTEFSEKQKGIIQEFVEESYSYLDLSFYQRNNTKNEFCEMLTDVWVDLAGAILPNLQQKITTNRFFERVLEYSSADDSISIDSIITAIEEYIDCIEQKDLEKAEKRLEILQNKDPRLFYFISRAISSSADRHIVGRGYSKEEKKSLENKTAVWILVTELCRAIVKTIIASLLEIIAIKKDVLKRGEAVITENLKGIKDDAEEEYRKNLIIKAYAFNKLHSEKHELDRQLRKEIPDSIKEQERLILRAERDFRDYTRRYEYFIDYKESSIRSAQYEIESTQQYISEHNKDIKGYEQDIEDYQQEIDAHMKNIEEYKRNIDRSQQNGQNDWVEHYEGLILESEDDLRTIPHLIKGINKSIERCQKGIGDWERIKQRFEKKIEKYEQEIQELKNKYDEEESKVTKLKEELETMKTDQSEKQLLQTQYNEKVKKDFMYDYSKILAILKQDQSPSTPEDTITDNSKIDDTQEVSPEKVPSSRIDDVLATQMAIGEVHIYNNLFHNQ